ncbi:GPI mannosyltransferase 4-like [Clytia hemisphaerica]|uniref:Mannosyltransferase n=1 Tax=Clytia hemisphaerica TaxID=252671 RepID=A0A7M5X2C4_9CNID
MNVMNLLTANKLLFILQWILIALPLNGYIHPDEYFQATEIMASDVLHLKSCRTWEWNCISLSRNVIFPTAVAGLPFWILKTLSKLSGFELNAQLLVIAPRIFMGFVTLTVDWLLSKFTGTVLEFTKEQGTFVTFLFRSSHVTLTFSMRTFSNNVESLLLMFILLLPLHKTKSSFLHCFIGFLNILGFFIRPSSLCFFVMPMFVSTILMFYKWWAATKTVGAILKYCYMLLVGGSLAAILCISLDSWYCTEGRVINWSISPLNLLSYNFDMENLKLHGIHPWYLHLTVNMILMFGPLYILLIWRCIIAVKGFSQNLYGYYNMQTYLAACVIVPVCILSLIRHQEPRYILSVLLPLTCFVATGAEIIRSRLFYISWLFFNFLGVIWFGFAHQAGVLPSISHLSSHLSGSNGSNVLIIYWKTYKVPEHLLLQRKYDSAITLKDMAGADWKLVGKELDTAFQRTYDKILLVCPSSVAVDTELQKHSTWKLEESFFPHITTEDLPLDLLYKTIQLEDVNHWLLTVMHLFSLNIYSVYPLYSPT